MAQGLPALTDPTEQAGVCDPHAQIMNYKLTIHNS